MILPEQITRLMKLAVALGLAIVSSAESGSASESAVFPPGVLHSPEALGKLLLCPDSMSRLLTSPCWLHFKDRKPSLDVTQGLRKQNTSPRTSGLESY